MFSYAYIKILTTLLSRPEIEIVQFNVTTCIMVITLAALIDTIFITAILFIAHSIWN